MFWSDIITKWPFKVLGWVLVSSLSSSAQMEMNVRSTHNSCTIVCVNGLGWGQTEVSREKNQLFFVAEFKPVN